MVPAPARGRCSRPPLQQGTNRPLRCSGVPPRGQEPETFVRLLDVSLSTDAESRQTDFIVDLNCEFKA